MQDIQANRTCLGRIWKGIISVCLKSYEAETLILSNKTVEKIRITQRKMERSQFGLSHRDRIRYFMVGEKTKLSDAGEKMVNLKWNWAGHGARLTDERWNNMIVEWKPRQET